MNQSKKDFIIFLILIIKTFSKMDFQKILICLLKEKLYVCVCVSVTNVASFKNTADAKLYK